MPSSKPKIPETLNGFVAVGTLYKLAYNDPRIAEVEGEGCEKGRIFIHLAPGYCFGSERRHSMTVGNRKEVLAAFAMIEKEPQ
jgi:hypothetical protein